MPCIPDQERSGVLCRYRHQGIRAYGCGTQTPEGSRRWRAFRRAGRLAFRSRRAEEIRGLNAFGCIFAKGFRGFGRNQGLY